MLQTPSITLAVEAGLGIAPDGFGLPNGNEKRQPEAEIEPATRSGKKQKRQRAVNGEN
jgi:hypothetical protein